MSYNNEYIEVIEASEHNLKNVSLKIPRNKLIVVTGLSGSGKTSLAFDTLYAEGQRRYVESLSSYARQFMGRIKKPAVNNIKGLPPAIAIEQKTTVGNSRSTVGTASEIYDYLKIFFARLGKTFSPISGKLVKKNNIEDIVDFVIKQPKGAKVFILSPVKISDKNLEEQLILLKRQGFLRVEISYNNTTETKKIYNLLNNKSIYKKIKGLCLIVDRLKANNDDDTKTRLADSLQTAFFEGGGICKIKVEKDNNIIIKKFSNIFEADGITFREPDLNMFNFNNPIGACEKCKGFGKTIGIDKKLVIPNHNLSVFEDAVACWKGPKLQYYKNLLIKNASNLDFNIHKAYKYLSEREKNILWNGEKGIVGIYQFFNMLEREQHKIQNRVLLSRYRGKTVCPVCKGARLKKEASYVKINGKSITDLVLMQLNDLQKFFYNIKLSEKEKKIAKHVLIEIKNRVDYMCKVGLGYLTLNRTSASLSGGEMQRINLSTALGSNLTGSLYVLDEPTIGLHPRDTNKLVSVLRNLQNLNNTVMVVEHEKTVIEKADWIIDLGPLAGAVGGKIVFQGKFSELKNTDTLTALYMSKRKKINIPENKRKPSKAKGFIEIINARQNNLKNISLKIPLGVLTAVTGVSGSGKSSLIKDVLFPALLRKFEIYSHSQGDFDKISGDIKNLQRVEFVDQNPLGRSARSNPATFIKAYDDIRKIFAKLQASKINGLTPGHFSFNVDGGRCEECKGEGYITVQMQFMANVTMVCQSCKGKRFKEEVLDVNFEEKNIYDILELTIDEAVEFFSKLFAKKYKKISILKNIVDKLQILSKVGLGYVKLGQSTSTLSGGESQRLKLASFIALQNTVKPTLFIFDEPTTGLHFDDIRRLLSAFNELVDKGHTIIFIEHNTEMIKNADWVIDLGPEGGDKGGNIIFEGTPENLKNQKNSYTAQYLDF